MQVGALFGRYRLDRPLSVDATGEVWAAFDTTTGRNVAVRALPPEVTEDDEYRARFEREAEIAARIRNPRVLPIHDFGQIGTRLFLATPVVEGTDLQTMLRSTGAMDVPRAVGVVEQLASALEAVHAAGLVEQEVTSANVLVQGDGNVLLTDVGFPPASRRGDGRLRPGDGAVRMPHRQTLPVLGWTSGGPAVVVGGLGSSGRHGRGRRTRNGTRTRAALRIGERAGRGDTRRGRAVTSHRQVRSRGRSAHPEPARHDPGSRGDRRRPRRRRRDPRGRVVRRRRPDARPHRGAAGLSDVHALGRTDHLDSRGTGADATSDGVPGCRGSSPGRRSSTPGRRPREAGASIGTAGSCPCPRPGSGTCARRTTGSAVLPRLRAHPAARRTVPSRRVGSRARPGTCTGARSTTGTALLPRLRTHPAARRTVPSRRVGAGRRGAVALDRPLHPDGAVTVRSGSCSSLRVRAGESHLDRLGHRTPFDGPQREGFPGITILDTRQPHVDLGGEIELLVAP